MAVESLVAKANTGSGTDSLAVIDIAGKKAGVVALADETGALIDAANPIPVNGTVNVGNFPATQPVSATALPLPSGAATSAKQDTGNASLASIDGKLPTLATHNPLSDEPALPVRLPDQKLWVCSFSGSGSVLSNDLTLRRSGTGVTQSQSSGNLVVASGTSTNAEWLARGTQAVHGAIRFRHSMVASQRIANSNAMVLLADIVGENLSCTINSATQITVTDNAHGFTADNVGQFMFVGAINGAAGVPGRYAIASVPDVNTIVFTVAGWPASGTCTVDLFGWSHVKMLYTGVTATNAAFDTQRRGWASGDSTLTINTTATPGLIAQMRNDGRNVYVDDTLRASATGPSFTTRGSRYENIPDDNLALYPYVWVYNGTTAPASSTTWTVSFLSVEDATNLPVYLAGIFAQGQAQALPVSPQGTTTVAGTVTSNIGTGTLAAVTSSNQGIPGIIADVASAALTTTTTTAAFTPTFGCSYEVNIPVTVVSGTSPTLDVTVQESDDSGTNWFDVYTFPRITATGIYRSPKLPLIGNRVRYVQTVGGTTPSFTRSINRLQSSDSVVMPRRQVMVSGQTAIGQGLWFPGRTVLPTFHAQVVGTGAVTANVRIWVRNISGGTPVKLVDIPMTGTTSAANVGISDYLYMEYMHEVTAITGTSAAVTVAMLS